MLFSVNIVVMSCGAAGWVEGCRVGYGWVEGCRVGCGWVAGRAGSHHGRSSELCDFENQPSRKVLTSENEIDRQCA